MVSFVGSTGSGYWKAITSLLNPSGLAATSYSNFLCSPILQASAPDGARTLAGTEPIIGAGTTPYPATGPDTGAPPRSRRRSMNQSSHRPSRRVDLRRRLQHRVVTTQGRHSPGLPHLTHAGDSLTRPARTRRPLSLGILSIGLLTFPGLLLVILRYLGCHPLRIPRIVLQLNNRIRTTNRTRTNDRLTHPVRLLMQHPLSSLHPKMRPQPRTPTRIHLRTTNIMHRETHLTGEMNRL